MRLRRPLPAVRGDTLHIVGVGDNRIGKEQTSDSSHTAHASHIFGDSIAKAVVLKDEDESHLLAVVPASCHINFGDLTRWLGRHVHLAPESEAESLFPDCEPGAVPALAPAYGLRAIVDEQLMGKDEIYLEGGDHKTLVKLSGPDFFEILADARSGVFSIHDDQYPRDIPGRAGEENDSPKGG